MQEISVAELAADESIPVIDVREQWEWREGHVPHAVHIPLMEAVERVTEIPDGAAIICRTGARSGRLVAYLSASGRDVSNVAGGTEAWIAAEYPVQTSTV